MLWDFRVCWAPIFEKLFKSFHNYVWMKEKYNYYFIPLIHEMEVWSFYGNLKETLFF